MKITVVIVTCNRLELLPRALSSVSEQTRRPDYVYVISNSTDENFCKEQEICSQIDFNLIRNYRTENYAGALNTGAEEMVKRQGIANEIYFASLDDDDIWLPDYLKEVENNNTDNFDLLAANYLRLSSNENLLMTLPNTLSEKDFLIGNPGIGGSNTFIRLKTLLKAGCFDEALHSSVDRDFFIRVFQQRPKYKIVNKHLVTAYTDKNRERLTTNREKKIKSLQIFFYKYQHLMNDVDKEQFFQRAKNYFGIELFEINIPLQKIASIKKTELEFKNKGNYQFVIGFIAGSDVIAKRVSKQIVQKIPTDLILIIDNTPKGENLKYTKTLLNDSQKRFKLISYQEWNNNLINGYYGEYFEKFDDINSIPLGRTILHRHLFEETIQFKNPVYWIIDDDIDFNAISTIKSDFDLFDLINENLNKTDAIIGGISNDPPIPSLSCIRTQLVDFVGSYGKNINEDKFSIHQKPDYYYDLSDLHSNHLEIPILKADINEEHLHQIFSGKAVSRPALQRELKSEYKTITRRGANTIVLNREVLCLYPVINLEVNDKFARRGDLTWALFNQVVSNKIIIEHSFCVNHNRPMTSFKLEKELEKSAYDIIGYAFNKAIFQVIEKIKQNDVSIESKDIFSKLLIENNFNELNKIYCAFLHRRKSRFLMNYYRIIGLTKVIFEKFEIGKEYYEQFKDETKIYLFEEVMKSAISETHLKLFLQELKQIIEENKH